MKNHVFLFSLVIILGIRGSTAETNHHLHSRSFSSKTLSPRIIEIEFLIDQNRWKTYQQKYGDNPMPKINQEIQQLLSDASQHLKKLDNGGFALHLHKPVELLDNSIFQVGPTYRDRRDNNRTRSLNTRDIVGYTFAFQDAVSRQLSLGWTTPANIVRFILAKRRGRENAAAEEFCLCNPGTFPCVGVFTQTSRLPQSVLLAHEIGHTLGVVPHHWEGGFIMSDPIQLKTRYVWSQMSRQKINSHNVDCLKRERPGNNWWLRQANIDWFDTLFRTH